MTDIRRFSSRRQRLDHAFLSASLKKAKSYKHIAGCGERRLGHRHRKPKEPKPSPRNSG
jgi:hypothetical protein